MKQISTLLIALCLFFQANSQMVVFADDYAAGVTFVAFGGSTNTLSIDLTQKHSGTSSLKIPVTTNYTGGALVAPAPMNLSGYNALTFWAKNDMPYTLDGVGLGNNATTTIYAVERNGVALTSTWTKYIIPIPVASKLTAETGLFHFAEGSGEGMYNIWIDDIQYETVAAGVIGTPTASFATETQAKSVGDNIQINGTTSTWPVNAVSQAMQTAKAYFTWTSSNASVATVNAMGVGTALAAGTTNITGMLGSVNASGVLTVNVSAAASAPAVAAPTPVRAQADVKSLFSNAYTNNAVETWSTSWSSGNHEYTELLVAGNDTKKYVLHHFAGVEFISVPIDATGYDYIHVDVWTPNANTPFTVRLVNFTPTSEGDVTNTPAANQWVGYDIPLSSFTGLGGKNKLSQMLFLVTPGATGTFYIDNVYFYKTGVVAPTQPAEAAPTPPARNVADVISLFSEAYTDISGTEWYPNWGQSTVVTDVMIAGNPTKKYTNFNYQGVNFTPAIDASAMTKVHFDIWSTTATAFDLFLINPGPVEQKITITPNANGTWKSVDLNLVDYNTIAKNNIFQFKLEARPSGSTVFLDNIYFYKGSPLPVSLSGFNVIRRGNTSVINWKTVSESNSKGFSVERSSNGTDWKELQFINSGLNSSATKTYSSLDKSPAKGINYYRLKQIDNDGKFTYSSVASLKFLATGVNGFSFYPNPAKNKITVLFETINSGSASLQLTNAEGKMVRNVMVSNRNSDSNITIDISSLTKGLYYIILRDGPSVQTTKVLID